MKIKKKEKCREKTANFHLCLLVYQMNFFFCEYADMGLSGFLAKISNLSLKNNVLFES